MTHTCTSYNVMWWQSSYC